MSKIKKTLLIITSALIMIVVLLFIFISPLAKYLVEKYDLQYTGRQITMDWAYVNPFTGYIHFNNLKIYELNSDSVFLSIKGLNANIEMRKLFSKTYEVNTLTLNQPSFNIIQKNKILNFSDLIKKFSSSDTIDINKTPVHFNLLNIKINEGKFFYNEKQIPIHYSIKNVNIESSGKRWNADTLAAKFSFIPSIGNGNMNGNISINFKTLDYRLAANINKYNLQILDQYLKVLTNYGAFSANLDASIKAIGNFKDAENITAKGLVAINEFHFGKSKEEDYASFDKLSLMVTEISPKNKKYIIESVSLKHPYLKYERYDYLDNIQNIFGKAGANIKDAKSDVNTFNLIIEIAKYIKIIAKNFFRSNYKINTLKISNANLKFNDFSTSEKFAISLDPLNITADSIDKNHKRVNVSFNSGIKPYGNAAISLSINPKDSSDFDMRYKFQKLPVSLFNPYTISFTSFPIDRGTLEFNGLWNVRNGNIQSVNHLVIIDPRLTRRIRNKEIKWLPMRLIMAFIRERGNVIDYEIPIKGNLKNPKFNLHDVVFDIIKNIFVKPATTLYRIQVKNIETEIEKLLTLKWELRSSNLDPKQERFLKRIANFLEKNPKATITVNPQMYTIKEKEYILFFEAKKKYYLVTNHISAKSFSEEDKDKVERLSVKDPSFIKYLNKNINHNLLFTIQDKCSKLISKTNLDTKYNELIQNRQNAFMAFFKEKDLSKRIKLIKTENVIPYNGFSFYKIEYKGQFPNSLLRAYRKMDELNDESPRKKFKTERKKNESII